MSGRVTMESVLESLRRPVASTLELSIVRIGYLKRTVVTRRYRNATRYCGWGQKNGERQRLSVFWGQALVTRPADEGASPARTVYSLRRVLGSLQSSGRSSFVVRRRRTSSLSSRFERVVFFCGSLLRFRLLTRRASTRLSPFRQSARVASKSQP